MNPDIGCMGTLCPKHSQCALYHAVDGSHPDTQVRIDSCEKRSEWVHGVAVWPMFRAVVEIEAA